MTRRLCILLLSLAAVLTLTAETCVTEETEIEFPIVGDTDLGYHAQAAPEDDSDSGTATIDVRAELQQVEEDNDLSDYTLKCASLQGVTWMVNEVLTGSDATTISGSVTITRIEGGASATLVSGYSASIGAAKASPQDVTLNAAGVAILNQALKDYINNRDNPPPINLKFDWAGTASETPYEFFWAGALKVTVVAVTTVEVPKSPI